MLQKIIVHASNIRRQSDARQLFHVLRLKSITGTAVQLALFPLPCHPYTLWPEPCMAVHYGPTVVKLLNFAGAHFFSSSPMGKLQHFHHCNHTIMMLVLFLFLLPIKLITCILVIPLINLRALRRKNALSLHDYSLCTLYALRHFLPPSE